MDLTTENKAKLAVKTLEKLAGGGFVNPRFVLKRWVVVAPQPDINRRAEVLSSFAMVAGKTFVPISANINEFELTEEPAEGMGISAVTSKMVGMFDCDEVHLRNVVNEYNLNQEELYMLVDDCKNNRTYQFGVGICCPAMLKIGFKSGKAKADQKGFPFTITVEDDGLIPIYRGVGSISREVAVLPDTASIDVSFGTGTYVLPENTAANEITALANSQPDTVYALKWDSTTNHSTIATGSTFMLASAFTPAKGAMLYLRAVAAGKFAEIGRYMPA